MGSVTAKKGNNVWTEGKGFTLLLSAKQEYFVLAWE